MHKNYMKFWGTRGSSPVNTPRHRKYGGNTACVEICMDNSSIIIDGGSGLPLLGAEINRQGNPQQHDIHIFLSHFHIDHICGIPFFAPLMISGCKIHFHTIAENAPQGFEPILAQYMSQPFYPVGPEIFKADLIFHSHPSGVEIELNKIHINSLPVPHPGGCHAYRISNGQTAIVYATDLEHRPKKLNEALLAFSRNADFILYDSTYDDHNFSDFTGFGHSTWQEGLRLVEAANIGQLAVFHHAPLSDDAALDAIADKIRAKEAQDGRKWGFVAADFDKVMLIDE